VEWNYFAREEVNGRRAFVNLISVFGKAHLFKITDGHGKHNEAEKLIIL